MYHIPGWPPSIWMNSSMSMTMTSEDLAIPPAPEVKIYHRRDRIPPCGYMLFPIGDPQPGMGVKLILEHPHVDAPIIGHSFRKKRSSPIIRMHDYGDQAPRGQFIPMRRNES